MTVEWIIDPVGWDTDDDPVPPQPAQWVLGEQIEIVDGVGLIDWPFADGSLRIRYDIVDQTAAIVSYDGACHLVVMPSDPPLGSQVFVDYQGR